MNRKNIGADSERVGVKMGFMLYEKYENAVHALQMLI